MKGCGGGDDYNDLFILYICMCETKDYFSVIKKFIHNLGILNGQKKKVIGSRDRKYTDFGRLVGSAISTMVC